jgi:hypothetical protein
MGNVCDLVIENGASGVDTKNKRMFYELRPDMIQQECLICENYMVEDGFIYCVREKTVIGFKPKDPEQILRGYTVMKR